MSLQLQQSCVMERLPSLFREYGYAVYETLFPLLNEHLEQYGPQIQVHVIMWMVSLRSFHHKKKSIRT